MSSDYPYSTSRWPVIDLDQSTNAEVNRTEFQNLDKKFLINFLHLQSSSNSEFTSRFAHTYMLSLGNSETAPLTPQAVLESKVLDRVPSVLYAPAEVSDRPRTSFTSHTGLRCDRPTKETTTARFDLEVARHYNHARRSSQHRHYALLPEPSRAPSWGFCRLEAA